MGIETRAVAHQLDVTLSVQHEILRLQVSVEDPFAMEVIERLSDATDAEFGGGLVKTPPERRQNEVRLLYAEAAHFL